MRVDLHIHSTASDGTWTPPEIVQQVQQAGIGLFAIADHDTLDSVAAAEQLAQERGLGFIRAVEVLTTLEKRTIHLLAYGIDLNNAPLLKMLQENRQKLESVDDQSIHLLIADGYDLTWQDYEAYQRDPAHGGWKAYNFLVDRGLCTSVQDFFGQLFAGPRTLQYPDFANPVEAVQIIHAAGGTVIWAHPGEHLCDGNHLLDQLLQAGVQGLECYSSYHDPAMIQHCLDLCRSRHLLISGGSDCHGTFAGRTLGQPLVYLDQLELGTLWKTAL